MTPGLVVLQFWKKHEVLEKKIFQKKKNPLFLLTRSSKQCAEIF